MTIVIIQIVIITVVVGGVYFYASRRDQRAPLDDIGVFWLLVFGLYGILPPLAWLIQGGVYQSQLSGRLFSLQPSASEVIYLLNIVLGYILGFSVVYLLMASKVKPIMAHQLATVTRPILASTVFLVVSVKLLILAISFSGVIGRAESYVDQYRVIQEAPLAIRQILKVLLGFDRVGLLIIVVGIFQSWPKYKFWIFAFVLFNIVSFDPEGGRASLATTLLSTAIAWHILVKPIKSRIFLSFAFFGLLAFLALGIFRGLTDLSQLGVGGEDTPGLGEFDSLWSNAVELLQWKNSRSLSVPFTARFGEFWEFIPSQILPFEKTSLSIWYLDTFYPDYKASGGGWAFGAISQAVIGGGVFEALLRGAFLGFACTWLLKWYRSKNGNWWSLPVYVYLTVFIFMTVRDTTMQPLSTFIQSILPGLLIVKFLGFLLSKK